MEGMLLSGKRDFDYEKEELFFLSFMKMIFIVCAVIFAWNVFSHLKQIDLTQNGTAVLANAYKYSGGERVSYVAEDGKTYGNNVSGMYMEDHEDTIMVYYLEDPATAMPLTKVSFFYTLYGITIVGMILSAWQVKRIKKSISKNYNAIPDEY